MHLEPLQLNNGGSTKVASLNSQELSTKTQL